MAGAEQLWEHNGWRETPEDHSMAGAAQERNAAECFCSRPAAAARTGTVAWSILQIVHCTAATLRQAQLHAAAAHPPRLAPCCACPLQLGYCTVYRFYAYPDRVRMRLSQILVLPPHQGRGVGSLLLKALSKQAEAEGAVDVTVGAAIVLQP